MVGWGDVSEVGKKGMEAAVRKKQASEAASLGLKSQLYHLASEHLSFLI